jgi:hypothetical protein
MLETYGNLWELADSGCDALVITTNGYVRRDGRAVMGKGIAKEAADRYLELPGMLGLALRKEGNHCFVFAYQPYDIVTFPVKPTFGPNYEPGWRMRADITLIEKSARELVTFADRYDWTDVLAPRFGCGNGQLLWKNVKPVVKEILDDRFTVVTFGNL